MRKFNLLKKTTVSLNDESIVSIQRTPSNDLISCLTSSGDVHLFKPSSFFLFHSYSSGICEDFKIIDSNTLLTCNRNSLIQIFDIRTKKVVCNFNLNIGDLNSVDCLSSIFVTCGEEDIVVGDFRMTPSFSLRPQKIYRSFHGGSENSIERVRIFDTKRYFSCGTDGMILCSDLFSNHDDEAILFGFNHESPVSSFNFVNDHTFVSITHMNDLSIWNIPNTSQICPSINVQRLGGKYFIDAFNFQNKLFSISGDQQHNIQICEISQQQQMNNNNNNNNNGTSNLTKISYLEKGHQDNVRCICFDPQFDTVYSGGDDGYICIWNASSSSPSSSSSSSEQQKQSKSSKIVLNKKKKNDFHPYLMKNTNSEEFFTTPKKEMIQQMKQKQQQQQNDSKKNNNERNNNTNKNSFEFKFNF